MRISVHLDIYLLISHFLWVVVTLRKYNMLSAICVLCNTRIYTYEDPTSLSFFNISPFTIECIDFSLISINANTRWTDSEQEMII